MLTLSSVDLRHDHVLMTHELLAAGYTDRHISQMNRDGRLHRLRHGAYTYGDHWEAVSDTERRRLVAHATLRCTRAPAVLSHTSAADVLGADTWDLPDVAHVTRLDARAGRRGAGRAQHRGHTLAEDVTVRGGVPITNGTKTALDVITIAGVERALVVANSLVHRGETSAELMARRNESMQHDPFSLVTDLVIRRVCGLLESVGETRTDHLFWTQHLPRPVPQYPVRDRSGRVVARVDFAWPELGVFLEFDGRVKYEAHLRPGESVADAVLREKRREILVCGLTGWRCIRLTWADLAVPERTAARIRATLAGEPWAA